MRCIKSGYLGSEENLSTVTIIWSTGSKMVLPLWLTISKKWNSYRADIETGQKALEIFRATVGVLVRTDWIEPRL